MKIEIIAQIISSLDEVVRPAKLNCNLTLIPSLKHNSATGSHSLFPQGMKTNLIYKLLKNVDNNCERNSNHFVPHI